MPMLSTEVLTEMIATPGRYLQWEMPIPCGSIKEDCFSIREADGRQIHVVASGGGRAVGDLLRQKLIHKDEFASTRGRWVFRPIDRTTQSMVPGVHTPPHFVPHGVLSNRLSRALPEHCHTCIGYVRAMLWRAEAEITSFHVMVRENLMAQALREYIRKRDVLKRIADDWPEGSEKRDAALEKARAVQRTIDDIKKVKSQVHNTARA